jgi:hypothetical protein
MAKPGKSSPIQSTPVRNSPIPRTVAPSTPQSAKQTTATKQITWEAIAKRAYEISQSPSAGTEFDNWIRAERELRGR